MSSNADENGIEKNSDAFDMSNSLINSIDDQDIIRRVRNHENSTVPEHSKIVAMTGDSIPSKEFSLKSSPVHTSMVNTRSYDDSGQEKKSGKRARTNYKDPENSAKLNAALSMLINQDGEGQIMKDIKSVAKIFGVPYNTLRDNFLRATTGHVNKLKKDANKRFQKPLIPQKANEVMYVPIPLTQFPVTIHSQSQGGTGESGLNLGELKPLPMHFQSVSVGQVPQFQQGSQQMMSSHPSAATYFICASKGSSSNGSSSGNIIDGSRMFFQMQPSAFMSNGSYIHPNLPQHMSSFAAEPHFSPADPPQQPATNQVDSESSSSSDENRIDRRLPPPADR